MAPSSLTQYCGCGERQGKLPRFLSIEVRKLLSQSAPPRPVSAVSTTVSSELGITREMINVLVV